MVEVGRLAGVTDGGDGWLRHGLVAVKLENSICCISLLILSIVQFQFQRSLAQFSTSLFSIKPTKLNPPIQFYKTKS